MLKNQPLTSKTFPNRMESIIDQLTMIVEIIEEVNIIRIGNIHHIDSHSQLQVVRIQNKEVGMTDELTLDTQASKIDNSQQKESAIISLVNTTDETTIIHIAQILTVQGNTRK